MNLFRTVPYLNQTLESNFSLTTRQNFENIMFLYSILIERSLFYQEYIFSFKFSRRIIAIFEFSDWLKYGIATVREQVR